MPHHSGMKKRKKKNGKKRNGKGNGLTAKQRKLL